MPPPLHLPDTDVIIAGGGPAGLMLAIELGRRGVSVALFDDDRADSFSPQANATQARTMEHFRRLGFADEIRRLGLPPDHPTDIVYYTTYAGYELSRFRLPTARQAAELPKQLSGSWSAAELPHRVSQMYVERVLQRQAAALPSVALHYEHEVVAVREDGARATATVEHDGRNFEASARYLVGCDGPGSLVRKHLGVRYEGEAGVQRNFAGGRMHAVHLRSDAVKSAMSGAPGWMHVNVHHARRSFTIALDGVSEFVFHTQLLAGEDETALTAADVRRMFAQCMGREIPFDILFRASWTAGFALVAERFREGRLFLAGDAAHLFTPMGGLGYNTAVEDAVNLGWKLAAVIHGWGGAGLLDSYELERKPAAVRNTGYARAFADSLGNFVPDPRLEEASPEGARLRAEAGAYFEDHGRREFNIPGITFGTRIDGSPVIVPDGTNPPPDRPNEYVPTACPGGRPPHAWLADGISLFDRFGFDFTLLDLAGNPAYAAPLLEAARSAGLPLRLVTLNEPGLRGLYEADYALIRPDQTVAWRGDRLDDAAAVVDAVRGAGGR
ncbi:MAG: FAD-dependent oxidoreductase [Alphaproteobacteria bacterium]|nr:FAD-dependent oxidoreductase [Alphaproteobacteria bacterium]